jgi:hypothetical protein
VISHPLLRLQFCALSSSSEKTVQKLLCLISWNMVFNYHCYAGCPRQRHSRVINVINAVHVQEIVLGQNNVFALLAQSADEDPPTFHRNVNSDTDTQAFADGRIAPVNAHQIAWTYAFKKFLRVFMLQTSTSTCQFDYREIDYVLSTTFSNAKRFEFHQP